MLKTSLPLVLLFAATPLLSQDLSQESDLVLRFTGPEALRLSHFMKERVRQETDFDQTRYYGDRMSLACREDSDCYLWLSRKEFQLNRIVASSSVISFTLPLQQSTWSGQLTLTDATGSSLNQVQLQLQDLYYPGLYTFTKPMACPRIQGTEKQPSLQGSGDCRLELSTSPIKGIPSNPSIQVVQNLDNIIVNFKGPWAKHLYSAAPHTEPDPQDPQRLRAQIGPETYCWNIDTYVCQSNLKRKPGAARPFISQGSLKEEQTFSLTLKPSFRKGIVQNFELMLHLKGQEFTVTHCPNYAKNAGFGQCAVFYDMKVDVGLYPLGNSVQGVAVGWGIIKKDRIAATPDH